MHLSYKFIRQLPTAGPWPVLGSDTPPTSSPFAGTPTDNISTLQWRYDATHGQSMVFAFKPPSDRCPSLVVSTFVWDQTISAWMVLQSKTVAPFAAERFDLVEALPDQTKDPQIMQETYGVTVAVVCTLIPSLSYPDGQYAIGIGVDEVGVSYGAVSDAVSAALSHYLEPTIASSWGPPQYGAHDEIYAGECNLVDCQGFNDEPDGTPRRYLMIFDDTADPPPNGTAPEHEILVPVMGTFCAWFPKPEHFTNGIVWAVSSTPTVLTLVNGAKFSVQAEIEPL
jgi:hypothetical protein